MDVGDGMLRDLEHRIEQQLAQAERFRAEVNRLTVTVESAGGEAVVTVDSSGGLTGLRLTDRALRLGPDGLARLLLDTSRRAQAHLAERMCELTGELYGAGSQTTEFVATGPHPRGEPDHDRHQPEPHQARPGRVAQGQRQATGGP